MRRLPSAEHTKFALTPTQHTKFALTPTLTRFAHSAGPGTMLHALFVCGTVAVLVQGCVRHVADLLHGL